MLKQKPLADKCLLGMSEDERCRRHSRVDNTHQPCKEPYQLPSDHAWGRIVQHHMVHMQASLRHLSMYQAHTKLV